MFGKYDWFASGSRVLITTRDKHLLDNLGKVCTTYEVKELDKQEALELFNQHAFQGNELEEDYFELANQVIKYARGLPLALTIIGSDLCGRTKSEWENAIHQYRNILETDIHEILKVACPVKAFERNNNQDSSQIRPIKMLEFLGMISRSTAGR